MNLVHVTQESAMAAGDKQICVVGVSMWQK